MTSPPSLTRTGSPGCARVPSAVCTHAVTSPHLHPPVEPQLREMGLGLLPVIPGGTGSPRQEQCCAPCPAQGTGIPVPSAGLPREASQGNSQGGAEESHTAREGAATGWTRRHCPLCPHPWPPCRCGSWPGHSCRAQIPQIPVPRGCTESLLPLGTHRGQGQHRATSYPLASLAQLLLSNKLRP